MVRKYGLVLAACLLAVTGIAQININQVMPVDPKVRIGRLPNGLTYYIRHNARPEKRVEIL